jgi:hypothetical protein
MKTTIQETDKQIIASLCGELDTAAAQETEAAHDAGRDAGRVEPGGSFEAELRDDHEQGGAQCDEHVRPHPGALGAEFAFIADDGAHEGGRQYAERQIKQR